MCELKLKRLPPTPAISFTLHLFAEVLSLGWEVQLGCHSWTSLFGSMFSLCLLLQSVSRSAALERTAPLPQQHARSERCLAVMKWADWHFSVPLCRSVLGVRHLIIINVLIGLCKCRCAWKRCLALYTVCIPIPLQTTLSPVLLQSLSVNLQLFPEAKPQTD